MAIEPWSMEAMDDRGGERNEDEGRKRREMNEKDGNATIGHFIEKAEGKERREATALLSTLAFPRPSPGERGRESTGL